MGVICIAVNTNKEVFDYFTQRMKRIDPSKMRSSVVSSLSCVFSAAVCRIPPWT